MASLETLEAVPARDRKPGWSFYLSWIVLSTLSIPIAFFLDLVILRVIIRFVGSFIVVDGVRHITEDYLGMYIFVPLVGLITGLLQYGLLRRYLPRVDRWVLATAGGWLLGVLLVLMPGWLTGTDTFLQNIDAVFIVMGLSIGTGQWRLLRRRLPRAGWWVPANGAGWALLGLVTPGSSLGQFGLLALGLLPACTTAPVLALLMNRFPPAGLQGK